MGVKIVFSLLLCFPLMIVLRMCIKSLYNDSIRAGKAVKEREISRK